MSKKKNIEGGERDPLLIFAESKERLQIKAHKTYINFKSIKHTKKKPTIKFMREKEDKKDDQQTDK